MTRTPSQGPVIEVKAQPSVYTVLLVIAILALGAAAGYCLHVLTADSPAGYAMKLGDLLGK